MGTPSNHVQLVCAAKKSTFIQGGTPSNNPLHLQGENSTEAKKAQQRCTA
jgi:hypothetical protein